MITTAEQKSISKDTNRQHWITHIKQWEESKLSQQAYCTQSGINLNSFTYWRAKFISSASHKVKAKFVRVKMAVNHAVATDAPRSWALTKTDPLMLTKSEPPTAHLFS